MSRLYPSLGILQPTVFPEWRDASFWEESLRTLGCFLKQKLRAKTYVRLLGWL